MTARNTKGARYGEFGYDAVAIAKAMRKEIARLVAEGKKHGATDAGEYLPAIKTSVRVHKYAGGRSIDIWVTAVPDGFPIWNPDRLLYNAMPDQGYGTRAKLRAAFCQERGIPDPPDRFTPRAQALLKALNHIHGLWNHDRSDSMSDHFDVLYHGDATFSGALEDADEDRQQPSAAAAAEHWLEGYQVSADAGATRDDGTVRTIHDADVLDGPSLICAPRESELKPAGGDPLSYGIVRPDSPEGSRTAVLHDVAVSWAAGGTAGYINRYAAWHFADATPTLIHLEETA